MDCPRCLNIIIPCQIINFSFNFWVFLESCLLQRRGIADNRHMQIQAEINSWLFLELEFCCNRPACKSNLLHHMKESTSRFYVAFESAVYHLASELHYL